jgi:hypothetical protein
MSKRTKKIVLKGSPDEQSAEAPDRDPAVTIELMDSGEIKRRDNRAVRLGATPEQKEVLAKRKQDAEEQQEFIEEERRKLRVVRKAEEIRRIADTRKPPRSRKPYNPAHMGQPTRERNAKTEFGFHEDNLAPNGAPKVVRAVDRAPLTPPEAVKRTSFLDKAIQDIEALAIFRFFVGTMVSEGFMRLTGEDNRQPEFQSSDVSGRLPFSEKERMEIGARQYVYSRLPEQSQADMDILVDQLMPRDRNKKRDQFYLSPVEQGKIISSSTDDRVGKGAYIGNYRKLAQHLNFLYVEWEMNQFRQRQERKALRKDVNSSLMELSTASLKESA